MPEPDAVAASAPSASSASSRRAFPYALAALPCFGLFAWLSTRPAGLFDADSYFHLAVARLYREQGLVEALPWARFSIMGEAYGDKEVLFHLLLIPVTLLSDLELGGQLALAAIASALALSFAKIAARAGGTRVGALVALLVMGTSATFALRAFRLRPELLSLLFMLWALFFLIERRYLLAACASTVFCLSHTGVHSLVGLVLIWTAYGWLAERELELRAPLSVLLGVAAGLVLHPHFPQNLVVFWAQNVSFFAPREPLDIGGELGPFTTATAAQLDAFWLLALVLLWGARTPRTGTSPADLDVLRRGARVFGLGALAFAVMYVHMGRFALYLVPLSTLALVYALGARGLTVGSRLTLPGGRSVPLAAALVPLCVVGVLYVGGTLHVNLLGNGSWTRQRGDELRALARALPKDAKVAAHWSAAEDYAFHAPWARYLNVLDPLFMQLPHPQLQALWDAILRGDEPDVPERIAVELDSEHIAFTAAKREALLERLANDPRMQSLHAGGEQLFRVRRDRAARFVTDFSVLPDGAPDASSARPYPRDRSARGQGLAGYVDATRVGGAQACLGFVHQRSVGEPWARLLELSPWGPTSLAIDGQVVAELAAPHRARLGAGVALPVRLAPGSHTFSVRTCPHQGRSGFYLLERARL